MRHQRILSDHCTSSASLQWVDNTERLLIIFVLSLVHYILFHIWEVELYQIKSSFWLQGITDTSPKKQQQNKEFETIQNQFAIKAHGMGEKNAA